MKKLIILLSLVLALASCASEETEQPVSSSSSSEESSSSETVEPIKKELLKLKHSLGDFDSAEGSVMDMYPANIPFEMPEGLENGSGENIEIPEETVNAIMEIYPDFTMEGNWHNFINYYTADFSYGMLEFIYYIENIATDKVVFCTIENGYITKVGFRNITAEADEEALLERVRLFEETHEQEKYEFKENEEFLSEDVNYVFYYVPQKLVYGYQLFFYMDTSVGKVINNEYFSEYEIP